jgi:hypothetical protein
MGLPSGSLISSSLHLISTQPSPPRLPDRLWQFRHNKITDAWGSKPNGALNLQKKSQHGIDARMRGRVHGLWWAIGDGF